MASNIDGCIALALAVSLKKRAKKRRSKWMKTWFKQRDLYGHQNLLSELRLNDPEDYRNFLRMDGHSFDHILTLVAPYIAKRDTVMREAISPSQRLSVTLRYIATGNTFEDLKFTSAISPQAIGQIVIETCEAIIHCLKDYIKMPENEEQWSKVALDFEQKWNFPHCIGAMDGKHVNIKKPPGSGSFYYNYKKHFSIVLMAIVNANYEFIMVDIGVNGRVSDGGVMNHTLFGEMFEKKSLGIPAPKEIITGSGKKFPYVIVADDAFALSENLLKPYSTAACPLHLPHRIFNYRLSRARNVVENAFGIISSRFGVFQRPILLGPEKAETVVLACCYLHNFLRMRKSGSYITQDTVDHENLETSVSYEGSWRNSTLTLIPLTTSSHRNTSNRAKTTRDMYRDYFSEEGSVPWQTRSCAIHTG